MTTGIPRSRRVKEKISKTLTGRTKSPETRAAMAASKLFNKQTKPEQWRAAYAEKLEIINAIEAIKKGEQA